MTVEYKGVSYSSERQLILSLGLKYNTVKQACLRNEVTAVEYLDGLEEGKFKRSAFKYRDIEYKSITHAVRELLPNIKVGAFNTKKHTLNISTEECLDRYLAGEFYIEVDGVLYESIADCLRKNDLDRTSVENVYRQSKHNYKQHYNMVEFLEKILRGEVIINPQKVKYGENEYNSMRDLIVTKYDYYKFYAFKQKLEIEDSLELFTKLDSGEIDDSEILIENVERKSRQIEFDGDKHKNLTDVLKKYGHTYHDYHRILNEGKASDLLTYLDYRAENPLRTAK